MTVVISDAFNGAAGSLTGHAPDVGAATWTDYGSPCQLDGTGKLTGTGAVANDYSLLHVVDGPDVHAKNFYVEVNFFWGATNALTPAPRLWVDAEVTKTSAGTYDRFSLILDAHGSTGEIRTQYYGGATLRLADVVMDALEHKIRIEGNYATSTIKVYLDDFEGGSTAWTPQSGTPTDDWTLAVTLQADTRAAGSRFRVSRIDTGTGIDVAPIPPNESVVLRDEFNGAAGVLASHVPDQVPAGGVWDGGTTDMMLVGNGSVRLEYSGTDSANNYIDDFLFPAMTSQSIVVWEMDYVLGAGHVSKTPLVGASMNVWGGPTSVTFGAEAKINIDGTVSLRTSVYSAGTNKAQIYPLSLDGSLHRVRMEADMLTLTAKTYIDGVAKAPDIDIEPGFEISTVTNCQVHIYCQYQPTVAAGRSRLSRIMGALKAAAAAPVLPFWSEFVNTAEFEKPP